MTARQSVGVHARPAVGGPQPPAPRSEARARAGRRLAPPGAAPAAAAPAASLHPFEESGRLAWQVTAAVGLLERFGDLLMVALDAVGAGDDVALAAALSERGRLVAQLEPLLAALAAARESAGRWVPPDADDASARAAHASRAAIAVILRPVDAALRNAQHLHLRLADEVRGRTEAGPAGLPAPLVLVP